MVQLIKSMQHILGSDKRWLNISFGLRRMGKHLFHPSFSLCLAAVTGYGSQRCAAVIDITHVLLLCLLVSSYRPVTAEDQSPAAIPKPRFAVLSDEEGMK